MPRPALTDKQSEVMRYMVDIFEATGFWPTYREMCAFFDWASTNAASDHVLALVRKGYVRKRKYRGYRVLP